MKKAQLKIPGDGRPSDPDLHQMHSYNVQFGAQRSLLLYPQISEKVDVLGSFSQPGSPFEALKHTCSMVFVELFDGDKLRRDIGDYLINKLSRIIQIDKQRFDGR